VGGRHEKPREQEPTHPNSIQDYQEDTADKKEQYRHQQARLASGWAPREAKGARAHTTDLEIAWLPVVMLRYFMVHNVLLWHVM
jgi:hypothetical protein